MNIIVVEAVQAKGFLDRKMCTLVSAIISCHACIVAISVVVGNYLTNVMAGLENENRG